MNIHIEFVDECDRYVEAGCKSAGDYFYRMNSHNATELVIQVVATGNEVYDRLLAVHELVEWTVNRATGVSNEDVDDWDMKVHPNSDDPGDEPGCPYQQGHNAGVAAERMLCSVLGLQWSDYEPALEAAPDLHAANPEDELDVSL